MYVDDVDDFRYFGSRWFSCALTRSPGKISIKPYRDRDGRSNEKKGYDNTILIQKRHMIGSHSPGDRNNNAEVFVDFCEFRRLVIHCLSTGSATKSVGFWTDELRTSNQIKELLTLAPKGTIGVWL